MIETLICETCGEPFDRERKRGIKPRNCPQHSRAILRPANYEKGETQATPQENTRKASGGLSQPHSPISDEALDLLTGSDRLEPELRRKLEYIEAELDKGRADPNDDKLLRQTAAELVRQHKRTKFASAA